MSKFKARPRDEEPPEQEPPVADGPPPEPPPEAPGHSVDGPTIAEEQRARSAEIEAAGVGNYPPDERPESERTNKQVPGVVNKPLEEGPKG
jgi:hypothetical protein